MEAASLHATSWTLPATTVLDSITPLPALIGICILMVKCRTVSRNLQPKSDQVGDAANTAGAKGQAR